MASVQDIFQATAAGVAAGAQLATAGATVVSSITSKLQGVGSAVSKFDPSSFVPNAVKDFPSKFADVQNKINENIAPVAKELEARNMHTYSKMMFPSDLGRYFISFTFMKYERPYPQAIPKYNISETIFLPFPLGLAEAFGVGYQDIEVSLPIGAVTDKVNQLIGGADTSVSTSAATTNLGAGAQYLAGVGSPAIGAAVGQTMGAIANPYISASFSGVPLREHTFSWTLSPNSAAESVELHKILQALKRHMLPQVNDQRTQLDYPNMCQILLGSDDKYLPKYKKSVLTSMSINYAPTGIPSFFGSTDAPTTYQVTLNFKELEIFTSEDIKDADKQLGTGQVV